MAAANYDLLIEQGATFRFKMYYGHKQYDSNGVLIVDASGNAVMAPYDITGCHARLQIRQNRQSPVLVSATTTNGGIVIPNGTDGLMLICLTDEATDNLVITRAKYDMEISYPSGDVVRILQGKVSISPNITQGSDPDNIDDTIGDPGSIPEQDVDRDAQVLSQPITFE